MSRQTDTVKVERDGGLATIVLNRPSRLNAIGPQMLEALEAALEAVSDARCVLLRGEGPGFCAGLDYREWNVGADGAHVLAAKVNPLLIRFHELPLPTVCAVQGACVGGGFGLAFAADIVLAAEDAAFMFPQARYGAAVDASAGYVLPRRLGVHRGLELAYSGASLTGREAAAQGLVNRAVPATELASRADELARQLADGPTRAFALSKKVILDSEHLSYAQVLDAEAAAQQEAARTTDFTVGIRAMGTGAGERPVFVGR